MPGLDGFVWWTGIVESRKDPEKLSRVQVRMYLWHEADKSMIATGDLFWAIPIFAINASNNTYTVKEGDAVFGFYMDGKDAQQPYIFGRFPDKPAQKYSAAVGFSDPGTELATRPVEVKQRILPDDGTGVRLVDDAPHRYPHPVGEQTTSRFARHQNLDKTPLPFLKAHIMKGIEAADGKIWDEVDMDYGTVYPYNDSKQSESGHYFDVDDTRKKERINLMHRSGTTNEYLHTGSIHKKELKHSYRLVHGSDLYNVRGNLWATTEKWTRVKSKGKTLGEFNNELFVRVANKMRVDVAKSGSAGAFEVAAGNRINLSATDSITLNAANIFLTGVVHIPTLLINSLSYGALGGPKLSPKVTEYLSPKEPEPSETDAAKSKNSKDQQLADMLSAITAETGGGAGARWCFFMPDGTQSCINTHHATPDSTILTYGWCTGATSITGRENSTGITTTYTKPDGFVCPVVEPDDTGTDTGSDGTGNPNDPNNPDDTTTGDNVIGTPIT